MLVLSDIECFRLQLFSLRERDRFFMVRCLGLGLCLGLGFVRVRVRVRGKVEFLWLGSG